MAEEAKKPAVPQALAVRQATLKKFDDYFSPDNRQAFLAKAGSAHGIDPARVKAAVLNYVVRDEYLARCTPESVFDSVVAALQLGIIPSKEQSFGYLVPYKDTCTLILGYKGIMDLARRSGEIVSIEAFVVHKNEVANLAARRGTDGYFRFDPIMFGNRGPTVGYCALVKLKTGGWDFETMDDEEVDRIRSRSSSWTNRPDKSPWTSDREQMALKTVLKRLLKRQPMAVEAVTALGEDDAREFDAEARDVTPVKGATQAERVKASMRTTLPAETATVAEEAPPHDPVTGEVTPGSVAVPTVAAAPVVERKPRAAKGVEVSDPQTTTLILDAITSAEGDEDLKDAFNRFQAALPRLSEQQKSNINAALELAGWKG